MNTAHLWNRARRRVSVATQHTLVHASASAAQRKTMVEDAEEKVRSLMEWRKELLREFTPAAFSEKEEVNRLAREASLGFVPELVMPPKPPR